MSQIKFDPWVGDDYWKAPFGKRVLVLGESHYDWDDSKPIDSRRTVTNEVVQGHLDGEHSSAFWTKIGITFLNKKPITLDEKRKFWNQIAFYNYVQSSAGAAPRISPTPEQFKQSEPAFFELLQSIKPEVIIILGNRLWLNLPTTNREEAPKFQGGENLNVARFTYPGGSAFALHIRHPSAAFNGLAWHSHVMSAIKNA